jgi:hypothetical protein
MRMRPGPKASELIAQPSSGWHQMGSIPNPARSGEVITAPRFAAGNVRALSEWENCPATTDPNSEYAARAGRNVLRLRGVMVAILVVGVAPARAQTPTPDPAPVPAPPKPAVVEPAPVTTTESESQTPPRAQKKRHRSARTHKHRQRSPVSLTAIHPTFAEDVPPAISRPAGATITKTQLPVQLAVSERVASPLVLVLVLVLGVGSLVVAALSSVPEQTRHGMVARLIDHRGELTYLCLALLVGLGVGLLSALVAQ